MVRWINKAYVTMNSSSKDTKRMAEND
jgi:hypothetical protein